MEQAQPVPFPILLMSSGAGRPTGRAAALVIDPHGGNGAIPPNGRNMGVATDGQGAGAPGRMTAETVFPQLEALFPDSAATRAGPASRVLGARRGDGSVKWTTR
ncbi:hypothetical protein GCM10010293_19880 [Streptomyces griseoflavus]|nr:hypothetical protein GCM10010293_19880 [Streptomyces griseoflavus]